MPLTIELQHIETAAMILDDEKLKDFRSSRYSFVERTVASRLRQHLKENPSLSVMDQYVESFTFETKNIEEDGDEVESGAGSTISLHDCLNDHEIMARFHEDLDPEKNGGVDVKYAALALWHKGILTVVYVEVKQGE